MLKFIGFLFVCTEQWRSSFGRIALFALVLAATLSLHASATTVAPPAVTVSVGNPMGDPTMSIRADGLPYYFSGVVKSDSVFSTGVDIYFGVILPDRMTVLTWVPSNGVIALNKGLVPFVRTSNERNFNTSDYLKRAISYTASGNEPLGMYWLFLLMVVPGGDPNDPRQWSLPIGIQPFFFDAK